MAKDKYTWIQVKIPVEAKKAIDETYSYLRESIEHDNKQKAELWIDAANWIKQESEQSDLYLTDKETGFMGET